MKFFSGGTGTGGGGAGGQDEEAGEGEEREEEGENGEGETEKTEEEEEEEEGQMVSEALGLTVLGGERKAGSTMIGGLAWGRSKQGEEKGGGSCQAKKA